MESVDGSGLSETFDLLTHPFRRYMLYYLEKESGAIPIDTLAARIAKWNGDLSGTNQPTREEITTALYHIHLPKLASAGVISFGSNRNTIELKEMGHLSRFLGDTAAIDGYPKIVAGD